jgi:hypothetical protein
MDTQARIPAALCALHNYIRAQDPGEGPLPRTGVINDNPSHQGQPGSDPDEHDHVSDTSANVFRDRIALQMWDDYQYHLRENNLADIDHLLDIDEEDIEGGDDSDGEDSDVDMRQDD